MEAKKFISTVLPDGHLSLPEDTAKDVGKGFEVILIPLEEAEVYSYERPCRRRRASQNLLKKMLRG